MDCRVDCDWGKENKMQVAQTRGMGEKADDQAM
jgi:hypothetical protein